MPSTQSIHVINRRRHHRESLNCDVQLQAMDLPIPSSNVRSYFGRACDISASGVKLFAEHPYPVDTHVLMTLEYRENGWTRITSRVGAVVWTKLDSTQSHCQLGIQFMEVDEAEIPY